ncbi:MAG: NAD(P)/FAD-dependent oxidoreductase [Sedimentisphaerales bacterium]|nr:NAD(P)/FAD-dependent oxidoreductase [Sedimentisphaerales bacterium]
MTATDVCIIGAGPAGLMAAIHAARERAETTVLEANPNAGRKLLLSGGGRCNLTHAATIDELVRAFGKSGRFLRHSFHELPPEAVRAFFAERGLPSRVEPDRCVFPVTDRAADVRAVLLCESERLGARLLYRQRVADISTVNGGFAIRTNEQSFSSRNIIIATGGLSWPQTGSTGDGYRFASALGHDIVAPKPSLVPLVTCERWPAALAGVSLLRVQIWVAGDRKTSVTGPLVFTQDGIGGPAALDLSRALTDQLVAGVEGIDIRIDLVPDLSETALDRTLQEQLALHAKKALANVLAELVPRRLASTLCALAQCDTQLQAGQLKKEARRRLVGALKALPLCVVGTRPLAEATVTRGGVSTAQIEPRTLQSRLCRGLFFAGEVLDVDGPCGGYSLQVCWSTGALAGRSAGLSR